MNSALQQSLDYPWVPKCFFPFTENGKQFVDALKQQVDEKLHKLYIQSKRDIQTHGRFVCDVNRETSEQTNQILRWRRIRLLWYIENRMYKK